MSQTLVAWQNLAKLATIVADSYEAARPPENTVNEIGDASTAWQTEAGVTAATITYTLAVAGSSVRVVGLFRTNLTTQAQITMTINFDGGDVYTETLSGPAVGYGQVIFILPATEYADIVTIEIEDATNQDACINVPLVFIGDAWLPTWSVSPSSAVGWVGNLAGVTTRGGQFYPTATNNQRALNFDFAAITETDAYVAGMEVARLANLGLNVLFILDAEGSNVARDAVFGVVSNVSPFGYLRGSAGIRSWRATVTERL